MSKKKDSMYIFLVSLLCIIPLAIADQGKYSKEEQVFKELPDHVKCDICISKETAKEYIHILPYEFIKLKEEGFVSPDDELKVTKVAARHESNSDVFTFGINEKIMKVKDLGTSGLPETYQYQIPFEVFGQWCKEHQEAYQEKLKATQQGDN